MKIVAFGASSSTQSINKSLAAFTASLVKGADVNLLDLNDFELPIFSQDVEEKVGQPQVAKDFLATIEAADAVIVSFAEHNGSYTAAYKNLFDWASRIDQKIYQDKPTHLFWNRSSGKRQKAMPSKWIGTRVSTKP